MRVIASRPPPGLLTLPWDRPLESWTDHVVPVPRGLSRHVVRVIVLQALISAAIGFVAEALTLPAGLALLVALALAIAALAGPAARAGASGQDS